MDVFWVLALTGVLVSVLSALESRVQWIASFCTFFGEGCRRTQDFTLLAVPISWWGIGYYALLALVFSLMPGRWTFWLVMAGLGFELTFLWVMARIRAFCIFCLFNAFVVGALAWVFFDYSRPWQAAAIVVTAFAASKLLISKENISRMSARQISEAAAESGRKRTGAEPESPAAGTSEAGVTVVEFSDPFCPACRKAHATARRIKDAYGERIRWVPKDFPLDVHKGAKTAAQAAHCAGEQDRKKFWEYRHLVFSAEDEPDAARLNQFAESLGLDAKRFRRCLQSGRHRSRIDEDIRSARDAGVTSTPTFIINERVVSGAPSFEDLKEIIDEELSASK